MKLASQLRLRARRLIRPAFLGTIRRTAPLSPSWGFDRGTPIDRYYIEAFLQEHRGDIQGRALEVRNSGYLERYGQSVERRDVLDIDPTNPEATLIADLSRADTIASDSFDCFVLTQTLQFIPDVQGAICHTHRILKKGGVVLVTVPCISRIAPRYGLTTDYWRFTAASCGWLFGQAFGQDHVEVRTYGNVLVGIAFLTGMAQEELTRAELSARDPYFPLIIAVRAVKA
jgi:SAM-dependent methyltransferase